ncbi:hypothetical protein FRC00_001779 [Tulasnella sp. 408]|nr:hypothetical protein FRC00_001779 [Tulasnella sp. 408]
MEASKIRSLCEGHEETPAVQAILSSLQKAALTAVHEFERRWTQEFPITVDAVSIAMAPIRGYPAGSRKGKAEQVNISTPDQVTDAEHAGDTKGKRDEEECENEDGHREGDVNAAASEPDAKYDADSDAMEDTGEPDEIIVEESFTENAKMDVQMSETGAGSDAKIDLLSEATPSVNAKLSLL